MNIKILLLTFLTLTTVGQPNATTVTKNGSSVEPERSSETTTRSCKQNEGEDYLQKVLDSGCTDKGKDFFERGKNYPERVIGYASGSVCLYWVYHITRFHGLDVEVFNMRGFRSAIRNYVYNKTPITYKETCYKKPYYKEIYAMANMIDEFAKSPSRSYEDARDLLLGENYRLLAAVCSGSDPKDKENPICQSCAEWVLDLRDRMNRDIDVHLKGKTSKE